MFNNQRRPWGVSHVLDNVKRKECNINYQGNLSKRSLTTMSFEQENQKRKRGCDVPPYCPGCKISVTTYMVPCGLCMKKYGPFENCVCNTGGSLNCMGESYHACCCSKHHPDLCLNEHYHECICPDEGCLSSDHRK